MDDNHKTIVALHRQFITQNYPHVLDMACSMIISGLQIVDRESKPASALMNFARNPDGSFHFSYQVIPHDRTGN